MGLDEGEVGEAHGLVPDGGGPGTRLCHKAAGLPRERHQTEVGTDRGQLQAAARGQQPVSGQPRGQERGPERGGVRPRPVSAVEVHAQPAAVSGARRAAVARPPRRLSLEVTLLIMFLELSAKLYTSVFHHGLKVGELVRGTGPGRTPKRPGKRTALLAPQEAARPLLRGRGRPPPATHPPRPPHPGTAEAPPQHGPVRGREGGRGAVAASPRGELF